MRGADPGVDQNLYSPALTPLMIASSLNSCIARWCRVAFALVLVVKAASFVGPTGQASSQGKTGTH